MPMETRGCCSKVSAWAIRKCPGVAPQSKVQSGRKNVQLAMHASLQGQELSGGGEGASAGLGDAGSFGLRVVWLRI